MPEDKKLRVDQVNSEEEVVDLRKKKLQKSTRSLPVGYGVRRLSDIGETKDGGSGRDQK